MIRLLREYLRPYWRPIVLVLALLLVQAIANLYLPTLNADIIDNGVVKGDTHYILASAASCWRSRLVRRGGLGHRRLLRGPHFHGASAATCAAACSAGWRASPRWS